jgi:hypothetical protein
VTVGKRRDDLEETALLVATRGSDLSPADAGSRDFLLFEPVVLVAELDELSIRKPVTTT